MTKGPKVDYGFLKDNVHDKIQFGTNVITGVDGNPLIFIPGSLDVPIAEMLGSNANLNTAYNLFEAFPTHANKTNENNFEKVWNHDYKLIGANVQRVANGDEHIIELGGYHSTVTSTTPWAKPLILGGLKATAYDILGGLHFESDFQLQAEGYVYLVGTGAFIVENDQIIMAPSSVLFAMKSDTHRKTDMTGLPRRVEMFVWVYAFNKIGCGPISLPIPVYLP
jgi:hypothetical protein